MRGQLSGVPQNGSDRAATNPRWVGRLARRPPRHSQHCLSPPPPFAGSTSRMPRDFFFSSHPPKHFSLSCLSYLFILLSLPNLIFQLLIKVSLPEGIAARFFSSPSPRLLPVIICLRHGVLALAFWLPLFSALVPRRARGACSV